MTGKSETVIPFPDLPNQVMVFTIINSKETIVSLVRRLGYKPLGYTPNQELNCIRPLGGDYPRFHLYIKKDGEKYIFNLHLDQKRPSYQGHTAHSGEYSGEVVREEGSRIQKLLNKEQ